MASQFEQLNLNYYWIYVYLCLFYNHHVNWVCVDNSAFKYFVIENYNSSVYVSDVEWAG